MKYECKECEGIFAEEKITEYKISGDAETYFICTECYDDKMENYND